MAEGVPVDESDGPIEEANNTTKAAEHDGANYVAVLGTLLLRDAACLAKHVDDCDDERSEGDAAKRICCCALERTPSSSTGHPSRLS